MAVTSAQQTAITNLYIALFNRAPDAAGFAFWGDALANGASLSTITRSLLASPESKETYPATQTSADFVASIYQTLFGRAPDASGLAFWTNALNAAGGAGLDAAKTLLLSGIIDAAVATLGTKPAGMTDAQYADALRDRELFNKKSALGLDFAVNRKSNDLVAAKLALQNAPAPDPTPVGTTFILTTGIDNFPGTAGNDTFTAAIVGGNETLDSTDILDGGAGIDTLNVKFQGSGTTTPTLRNIEIINVLASSYRTLDLGALTGLTHAGVQGNTGSATILKVGNAALAVADTVAEVTFSGSTATTLSLSLSNVGGSLVARVPGPTSSVVNLTDAEATQLNIVASNANVQFNANTAGLVTGVAVAATGVNGLKLSTLEAGTVKVLAVTGSGSVDFSASELSALTTVTATGAAIKLTSTNATASSLTVTTGAGADTIIANGASIKSLQLGAGNDTVTLNTGSLRANAVLDLGAGDDTITVAVGSVEGATISGGAGTDSFVFSRADVDTTAGGLMETITDFVTNVDKIKVTGAGGTNGSATTFKKASAVAVDLSALLTAADLELEGTFKYYVGQLGADSYLFTDANGIGYTNVIKLTNVALAGIKETDVLGVELG